MARNTNDRTILLHPVSQAYAERCKMDGGTRDGFYCWAAGGGLDEPITTDHFATEEEAWLSLRIALAAKGRRI